MVEIFEGSNGLVLEDLMKKVKGIVLCYSNEMRDSFLNINYYLKKIYKHRKDFLPIILAANKCDLELGRKVTIEESKKFSQKTGIPFFECSSLLKINVDDLFCELIRTSKRQQKQVLYFTGDGVKNFFGFETNFKDEIQVPSINTNMKNIWQTIFTRYVFSTSTPSLETILPFKLVCKYWHKFLSEIFQVDTKSKLFYCYSHLHLHVTTNPLASSFGCINKYIYLIDLKDPSFQQFNETPIQFLSKMNLIAKKDLVVVLYNLEFLKKQFPKYKDIQKKYNKLFQNCTILYVDNLSKKNILNIAKKIDSKNHKKLIINFAQLFGI